MSRARATGKRARKSRAKRVWGANVQRTMRASRFHAGADFCVRSRVFLAQLSLGRSDPG